MPIRRSSSLSRSNARRKATRSSGYSSWRWICSRRERPARVQQQCGQVEEALQLLTRHPRPYCGALLLGAPGSPIRVPPCVLLRRRLRSVISRRRKLRATERQRRSGPGGLRGRGTYSIEAAEPRGGGPEEQGVLLGPAAHRGDAEPEPLEERERPALDHAHVVASVLERAGVGEATRTGERTRSSAVWEWWLTPRCRSRPSPSDMRSTATGRPPSAAAASRIGATSSAVVPSGEEVPTTPGPIATMATSACATCRARASADGTDTASRSPPNACPAVMVTSINPTARHRVDQIGDHDRAARRRRS